MKNYRITKLVVLFLVCCATSSCENNNEIIDSPNTITVYGTVLNAVDHEPIIGAEVIIGAQQLIKGTSYWTDISSSVSGSDGQYELVFGQVEDAMFYYIKVSCDGYVGYNSRTTFSDSGTTYKMDLNLKPR